MVRRTVPHVCCAKRHVQHSNSGVKSACATPNAGALSNNLQVAGRPRLLAEPQGRWREREKTMMANKGWQVDENGLRTKKYLGYKDPNIGLKDMPATPHCRALSATFTCFVRFQPSIAISQIFSVHKMQPHLTLQPIYLLQTSLQLGSPVSKLLLILYFTA